MSCVVFIDTKSACLSKLFLHHALYVDMLDAKVITDINMLVFVWNSMLSSHISPVLIKCIAVMSKHSLCYILVLTERLTGSWGWSLVCLCL